MTGLAIVESPLQVLGLLDALLAGSLGPVTAVVRTDPARATFRALAPHVGAAAPPITAPASLREVRRAMIGPADVVVLGDPFSGVAQSRLLLPGRPSEIVLVDDGTATGLVVDALLGRAPLVRAHVPVAFRRRVLGAVASATLARQAGARRLTLRTCVGVPDDDRVALAREGVVVAEHTLGNVRALDVGAPVTEDVVVLGSALADDGLIAADAYDAWLTRTVDDALSTGGTVRYLAHRREPASRLAALARRGVRTDTVPLPAELRLRPGNGVRRVVSLPTSVLLTIGAALVEDGVDVDAQYVPDAWWTASPPAELRAHLDQPRARLADGTGTARPRQHRSPGDAAAAPGNPTMPSEARPA
ncbi:hypothetical protein [Sanguibacter massiliensis]|uniref:hypothetical protein n=1 Tax=Sanguibacter massiliensis TaxID=1973217 RepID=UPI000C860B7A|nr:hypothetical protein [Sanguibacter massiliensis]